MKKSLLFIILSVLLVCCIGLSVGCNRTKNPSNNNTPDGTPENGLPPYDTTENATIRNEFSPDAARYKVFDGQADSVYDESDAKLEITCEEGVTYISADYIERSGIRNFKVYCGKTLTYVRLEFVQYIKTCADYVNINNNLGGYYILANDLYFENEFTVIGRAPLIRGSSTPYTYDKSGRGSTAVQLGVPFTGVFDGDGHTIHGLYIAYESSPNYRMSYCLAMFAYVGEGAFVGNFELKASSVKSAGYYGAMIAGVNLGTIENVTIHKDCSLEIHYADMGGIALYNGGTISDVDCYVVSGTSSSGSKVLADVKENSGEKNRCYIGAPYPVQAVIEEDEASFIEGLQPDFDNVSIEVTYSDGEVKTLNVLRYEGYDPGGTVAVVQDVKLYYGEGANEFVTMHVTPTAKSVTRIEFDGEDYRMVYTVNAEKLDLTGLNIVVYYNNNTDERLAVTEQMLRSDSYNLAETGSYVVKIEHMGCECSFVIAVIDAEAELRELTYRGNLKETSYPLNGELTAEDLEDITLVANYSTGEPIEMNVTLSMVEYDFSHVGETSVIVRYADKTVQIPVTVYDYETELVVALKGASKELTYSAGVEPDFSSICEYSVVMASGEQKAVTGVTASGYRAGLCNSVVFTYGELSVTSDIGFEIWYIITNASEWAAMNDNLAGYYRLGGDITLDENTSAVIGVVPLRHISSDEGYDVDVNGTDRVGVPFTGKFDGNNHTIYGFTSDYTQAPYDVACYGLTPFAYIGAGAYVGKFTLSGASIRCGQAGSFIASLNMGEISDVTIAADCLLYVHYGSGVPAAAFTNGGTITNVTCYVTTFHSNWGERTIADIVKNAMAGGVVTDCQIVDPTKNSAH